MKYLAFLIAFTILLSIPWFACHPAKSAPADSTKLLYSDGAIALLKDKIKLKNNSFKPNVSDQKFSSIPQGVAGYLSVTGVKAAKLRNLILGKERWEMVSKDVKSGEKVDNVFFIKSKEDEGEVGFYPLDLNQEDRSKIIVKGPEKYEKDLKGTWVYSYYPATEYSEARLDAMYIWHEFKRKALPLPAIDCIRYTDHLIDTNSTIFSKSAFRANRFTAAAENPFVDSLLRLTNQYPGEPSFSADTSMKVEEQYNEEYARWEQQKRNYIRRELSKTEKFTKLLNSAYQSVATSDNAYHSEMNEFENYVELYISPQAALELKRKRVVMGNCSMDRSPIIHAANIARLAGETCCMDIFLQAHLNILYDRFERLSDGSYAEEGRQTYAKELEVIGVNLAFLIPGTLLAADNFSKNHYRGELNRAGRAMVELQSRKEIYKELEKLVQNPDLDYYNRLILIFLAESYNHYLMISKQEQESNKNLQRLKAAINTFPDYIKAPLSESIKSIEGKH